MKEKTVTSDLMRIEFFRHGIALIPKMEDKRPGIAYSVDNKENQAEHWGCTCSEKGNCKHVKELSRISGYLRNEIPKSCSYFGFQESAWFKLASLLYTESSEMKWDGMISKNGKEGSKNRIAEFMSEAKDVHVAMTSEHPITERWKQRIGLVSKHQEKISSNYAIQCLSPFVYTRNEREMNHAGVYNRRQAFEKSFWYRFAYHCFREFEISQINFHVEIDQKTGAFWLQFQGSNGYIFRFAVPKNGVKAVMETPLESIQVNNQPPYSNESFEIQFQLEMNEEEQLRGVPWITFGKKGMKEHKYNLEDLHPFCYRDLIYIPDQHMFITLPKIGFSAPIKSISPFVIPKKAIPDFLSRFRPWCKQNAIQIHSNLPNLTIYRDQLDLSISSSAINRDWCWISMHYPFGKSTLSITDILHAKEQKRRYLQTETGWLDLQASHIAELSKLLVTLKAEGRIDQSKRLKLSRLEFLKLTASAGGSIQIDEKTKYPDLLKKIIDLQPKTPLPSLDEHISPLRHYQEHGVSWLRFLYENGLGGLLCDDMGLGKTHQVMALIVLIKKLDRDNAPILIVCPTTVMHHWYEKIKVHTKGIQAELYNLAGRNWKTLAQKSHVLITSYGIFRNDIHELASTNFCLAVFDEAQYLKNKQTLAHQAAKLLHARVRIGLTGTPIENHVFELKALFDIVLPGYLGTDHEFEQRYTSSSLTGIASPQSLQQLKNLVAPFVLRRMKQTVLDELPEKIEDVRSCYLSEDQVKLYRQTIASKSNTLRTALESDSEKIPYIHIFALLTLLKQICDHPALAAGKVEEYDQFKSGKWELFKEILQESLESGQKIVIFSQFLEMIRIIETYLTDQRIQFVTLTGSSCSRGKIVSTFNEDPKCRVFVGSLMAGGTGIDLISGSVVIHYDRWWNAAREDQATDRLHRIGQKNVVQVFKLITKGTLEEKIAAIIERKRKLMNSVIKEDDPNILKTLERQELLDLISMPVR